MKSQKKIESELEAKFGKLIIKSFAQYYGGYKPKIAGGILSPHMGETPTGPPPLRSPIQDYASNSTSKYFWHNSSFHKIKVLWTGSSFMMCRS